MAVKYREVSRKAQVGDLIRITDVGYGVSGYHRVGDITTLKKWGPELSYTGKDACINDEQYVVLEPIASDDSDDTRIATLDATVKSLAERVEALEKRGTGNALIDVLKTIGDVNAEFAKKRLTRADVVEMAIRDVEELKNHEYPQFKDVEYRIPGGAYCKAEFIVNRKKRTVVCLLRGVNSNVIRGKGIAKSAPDDCFNVHIGKAIALRRALGLDVPDEYVNAPKPTEAQVGDVVDTNSTILGIATIDNSVNVYETRPNRLTASMFKQLYDTRILDDSHDFGGEGQ